MLRPKTSLFQIGGPLWIGPLHNELFVADLIKQLEGNPGQYGTEKLMRGKLGMVQEVTAP